MNDAALAGRLERPGDLARNGERFVGRPRSRERGVRLLLVLGSPWRRRSCRRRQWHNDFIWTKTGACTERHRLGVGILSMVLGRHIR